MILACDRGNQQVSHLYDCKKRPVRKAIRSVIKDCPCATVPVVLFLLREDMAFFLEKFDDIPAISICCSEYLAFA